MENKRVLFITFDMSGYYDGVHEELKNRFETVDYFNTAQIRFDKYKSILQKAYAFFYKIFTGNKLKNFYKYQQVIDKIEGKEYDVTLIVRPDLFFDSQLEILKRSTKRFIAYYHDSINNIPRKKKVISYFDKVYSYEKKDVLDYNLDFLSNFIYFDGKTEDTAVEWDAFSVMSEDYRLPVLKKVAENFKSLGRTYRFCVMSKKPSDDNLITYISKRMTNDEALENIKKSNVIVDIHKFGVQDGLTFRVFESLGLRKKLITTNKDIVNYDFFNPNNIFVIENLKNIAIPESFFETPYQEIPYKIYANHTKNAWLDKILET